MSSDPMTQPAIPRSPELVRGRGPSLGPLARRYEQRERTLLRLLRDQAAELGDRDWLVFDEQQRLSFRAAFERSNQFAHALRAAFAEPCHVALMLRNQLEFYPAFLGAMAAGGVTVPLNADSRGPLLEYVIAKSDARAIVVRADLLERLSELDSLGDVELIVVAGAAEDSRPRVVHGAPVVSFEELLADQPTTPAGEPPDSSEVALIQFTSGTTGRSKGVVYPHHFLYLYSAMIADRMQHTREDVLFSSMPLFHVAALHLIANAALHAGCAAHLRSRFSASAFWEQVVEAEATHTVLLGPMAQIILKTVRTAPPHRVRIIYCPPYPPGGEEFQERFGVKLVWQGFGMTEIYTHPYFDHDHEGVPKDTVGHPVDWMEYGVVDEHDRPLAIGEVGELVFRPLLPDAMARGYYRAPEATVEAFRNFMFHTGDLAYLDEQARVHFKGRKQDRIRRLGENVSAAELEHVALGHPLVVEAAAYGVPGEFGEHDVKLDVVCAKELALAELHEWLAGRLPRFMVPRYLERCEELPKTPSERVEKYKLASRPLDRPQVQRFDPARR